MNKRLFAALILVVILGPFCVEAFTIQGTVYYSTDPVNDVLVELCPDSDPFDCVDSTFSDSSGHYEFLDVAPGSWRIPYRKPGDDTFVDYGASGTAVVDSDVSLVLHLTKLMLINGFQPGSWNLHIHEQHPELCWTYPEEATRFSFSLADGCTGIEQEWDLTESCYQVKSELNPFPHGYFGSVVAYDYLGNPVGDGVISFEFYAPPNIEATPSSHDFEHTRVRQCSTPPMEFVFSNTGDEDLIVSAISLSNAESFTLLLNGGTNPCNVSNPTISPGGSCTVAVAFCPSTKGNKFADLTVTSNDPDTSTLTVELSGTTLDHGWGWVVTIDGMDPWSSAFSWPNPTTYLSDAITDDEPHHWRSKIIQNVGPILPFIWTRNTGDTETTVQQLYEHIRFLNSTNRPVVILSHSWGTVLAYIALHEHGDIYVNELITLGSPLDSLNPPVLAETAYWLARFGIFSVDKPENLGIWHNYWTLCDPITAPISALSGKDNFVNKKRYYLVRPAVNLLDCHRCYFEDSSKWNKILKDVIKR
jgi:pimeloyl-ACP methyl ester carboxylesterase